MEKAKANEVASILEKLKNIDQLLGEIQQHRSVNIEAA